jgi:CarD family transcriptional regulator
LQLSIGQTVVHPNHGIGKITDVTKMDLVKEFKRYYVIDFITKNLTSSIPIRKMEELKLRTTMSREKVKKVFTELKAIPQSLPKDYKRRRAQLEAEVHSGNPVEIAKAVRDLTWRKESDRLSTSDSQLLTKGREMLIEEIALVTESETYDASQRVDQALTIAIEAKQIEI